MDGAKPRLAPIEATANPQPFRVAVRTLCEFVAKTGDLDLRFTPSPTAQQGIAGHQAVQARRGVSYCPELRVEGAYKNLVLRGRVDGYDADRHRIEEIKTCVGTLDDVPPNQRALHWAQAKVYGALLCRQLDLPQIEVALVYFDIREQRELPPLVQRWTAADLDAFLADLCESFLIWAHQEAVHRAQRDRDLEALAFPQTSFRHGQRDLAKAVFNAARGGHCLLAQAPTGIGKTLGVLFPMLKAAPRTTIDRILFLTAKGSGRSVALDTLRTLGECDPPWHVRTLELTARSKACEHPDKACHGDACPLARGFYDRLPAARREAVGHPLLTRETLREIALLHGICPYHLGQEMARWCDVVVADYNHYFDRTALLHALTRDDELRVALLVDEAHNLLDRAREMYTASISSAHFRSGGHDKSPPLRSAIARIRRHWNRIVREAVAPYAELQTLPRPFATALRDLNAAFSEHFAQRPAQAGGALLDVYFDTLAFERALTECGEHSMIDLRQVQTASSRTDATLTIRNVLPAPFLVPRFSDASTCVLFSATLAPASFHVQMLGLPKNTQCIDIDSPFDPRQLAVRVIDTLSTRYRDRESSIEPLVEIVRRQAEREPGNYLVFLSSHDYLERVADRFATACPHVQIWRQTRQMTEHARETFLSRFSASGNGIGFAVLGGVFAEGVDLVGTRLVGAFIATLGLPQVNEVNEAMRRRIDRNFGTGYDYTYLYPGLRKVIQAAGRVIRTPSDRGCVYLIDDRYARPEVRKLLPAWWRLEGGCG